MNRSLLDRLAAGEPAGVLLVSNFTVAGDCAKGRRPSFDGAMRPPEAERMFDRLVDAVRATGLTVETGAFGAHMDVAIHNDGPVTLTLHSPTT
jgi:D-tyrosyl-tRNA(Tyr) deacylase